MLSKWHGMRWTHLPWLHASNVFSQKSQTTSRAFQRLGKKLLESWSLRKHWRGGSWWYERRGTGWAAAVHLSVCKKSTYLGTNRRITWPRSRIPIEHTRYYVCPTRIYLKRHSRGIDNPSAGWGFYELHYRPSRGAHISRKLSLRICIPVWVWC